MEHYYQNIGENWFEYQNLYSKVVKEFPNNSHFVEVGSWKGRSACYLGVEIVNSSKSIRLDCVDHWEGDEQTGPIDANKLYNTFLNNIEPIKNIINPIRLPSLEAVNSYKDESLEFVFIDASHDYNNVLADIKAWYPKIKNGGILGGHDYNQPEVKKAVHDYLEQNNLSYEVLRDGGRITWYFWKK